MSNSLNSNIQYLIPDESDLVRIKSPIYNDIYYKALAMQRTAILDLIKLEQSSTMYNYIHNPIATGNCLISDRHFALPSDISTYTIRFPLPRFGDAIQCFKLQLPPGHRVCTARARLEFDYNSYRSTHYETCHITHNVPYFNILAYSELFIIGYENVYLELICECRSIDNEIVKTVPDTKRITHTTINSSLNGTDSSQPQFRAQLWADYIFYSTNERSKKLFSRYSLTR